MHVHLCTNQLLPEVSAQQTIQSKLRLAHMHAEQVVLQPQTNGGKTSFIHNDKKGALPLTALFLPFIGRPEVSCVI